MEPEQTVGLTEPMRDALAELESMIIGRYSTATFTVSRGEDDPEDVHLNATVDLDDPDEVQDLVIECVLQFQLDDGLPIHVVPLRTPQRVATLLEEIEQRGHVGRPGQSRLA